ncbi:hypothetical protein [Streptomyces sp. t39]|uniref:hypothetical protein n=1 Tax=Streptomyces sp. t39 TaxID=1828156 RepID=UPI0011CDDE9A|nr:hypothetical protein [Streptomyces sp. t39]TXS44433.1 hypothetical protein EAO77_33940 [Streptomyces sp. t39]
MIIGRAKARLKQLRGRMEESDGIVLENERLREEGRRRAQQGREEEAAAKARAAARRRDHGPSH